MIPALIMAGGRGERMRASLRPAGAASVPKPLITVRGVPLLERNLVALLKAGLRDVSVAVSSSRRDVEEFAGGRGRALARALGGEVSCLREETPLGTIGAVSHLRGRAEPVLVVNADNLTAIDLRELIEHHRRSRASMTIAMHLETFVMPFGELRTAGGNLTAYIEKPRLSVSVSSGVYVLDPTAIEAVPQGQPESVPSLVERLLAAGAPVAVYEHAAPWMDVNDAATVERADAMVAAHPELFERWGRPPDVEVVGALIRGPEGVLLEWRPEGATAYPAQWDTPGGKIERGESPEAALARELREELALEPARSEHVGVFDDLDLSSKKVFRHHVFVVEAGASDPSPRLGQELRWVQIEGAPSPLSPIVARSLALAMGARGARGAAPAGAEP